MENRKRNLIVIVLLLIGTFLITVGTTIAFFNYAKTGSTENSIETGHISFIYEEVSKIGNGIGIEDALPISDIDGKGQTGVGKVFDFKVTSTTTPTVSIPYEITARVVDGSDDLTDYVKVYLTKLNGNTEEQKVLSIYSDLSDSTNVLAVPYGDKTLYTDTIAAGSTNYTDNYRLRIWLNDDTNDGSVLNLSPVENSTTHEMEYPNENKSFTIKINVYANGEQVSNTPTHRNYTVVSGDINTPGSEICLDTECFYVIGNEDATHVKLLAKHPIKIGANYDENTPGYLLQYQDYDYNNGDGTIFSSSAYWVVGNTGTYKDKYTEDDGNGNRYVYDENSLVYPYVEGYVEYLQNQGFNITSGRLLSTLEAKNYYNCEWYYDNYDCVRSITSSFDENVWLGNDEETFYVMVASGSTISGSNYDIRWSEGSPGVLPLVILEK